MRGFLAIPVAEPALGAAQRLLGRLRDEVGAVRWARAETLHITVHFFGAIADEEGERAVAAVAPAVARATPIEVTLVRLGSFPEHGWPRVLWLGSAVTPLELTQFARSCRDALGAAGFAVETREYRDHCTLGRPRTPWPDAARDAWRRASEVPFAAMRFRADRLILYESRPAAGGSIHTPRRVLAFGG